MNEDPLGVWRGMLYALLGYLTVAIVVAGISWWMILT